MDFCLIESELQNVSVAGLVPSGSIRSQKASSPNKMEQQMLAKKQMKWKNSQVKQNLFEQI